MKTLLLFFTMLFIPGIGYAEEISDPFNERFEVISKDYEVEEIENVWIELKADFTKTRLFSINHLRILIQAAEIDFKEAQKKLEFWKKILEDAEKEAEKVKLKGQEDIKS